MKSADQRVNGKLSKGVRMYFRMCWNMILQKKIFVAAT